MSIFADTSAVYALPDRSDRFHGAAAGAWNHLIVNREMLVTSNYVIVECFSLAQRRLGVDAARDLGDRLLPVLRSEWVDESDHRVAQAALLTAGRRDISLVDYSSFHVMRRAHVRRAFTFDPHFAEQGFEVVPEG